MSLNWDLCIICQCTTREALRCPMKSHSFDSNVYGNFLTNVTHFKDLNSLPVELKFNTDTTTTDGLIKNNAKMASVLPLKI